MAGEEGCYKYIELERIEKAAGNLMKQIYDLIG
jgi:hypothetical protein